MRYWVTEQISRYHLCPCLGQLHATVNGVALFGKSYLLFAISA